MTAAISIYSTSVSLKKQKPTQPNTIVQRALILANFRAKGETYTRQEDGSKNFTTRESVDIAMYVDASFVNIHEPTGLGGVIRNRKDGWEVGFSQRTFARDNSLAELRAIKLGLQIAKEQNIHTATIFSDCLRMVNLLCNHAGYADNYVSDLCECRKLWRDLPGVKIKHCSRNLNMVADGLAKECRINADSMNVTRFFPTPQLYFEQFPCGL